MGCLSSKIVTRSMSLQEELNQSVQKSANSLAVLEDLPASKKIDNQLLALVRNSSRVASNLRSGSFSKSFPEPEVEHSTLEHQAQENQGKPAALMMLPQPRKEGLTKGSKSCHWFPEGNFPERFDGTDEERFNHKGIASARSFHTIEEYDAMVERIRLSMADETEKPESHSKDKGSPEENSKTEASSISPGSELESRTPVSNAERANATEELDVARHCSDEYTLEKGFKRKSIAKGLESLEVPQSIELQAVASLREWLHAGEVYSHGANVNPKFGSYYLPNSRTEDECNDNAIFNPELVAAFEERMQQLEAEAETILNQIAENIKE